MAYKNKIAPEGKKPIIRPEFTTLVDKRLQFVPNGKGATQRTGSIYCVVSLPVGNKKLSFKHDVILKVIEELKNVISLEDITKMEPIYELDYSLVVGKRNQFDEKTGNVVQTGTGYFLIGQPTGYNLSFRFENLKQLIGDIETGLKAFEESEKKESKNKK